MIKNRKQNTNKKTNKNTDKGNKSCTIKDICIYGDVITLHAGCHKCGKTNEHTITHATEIRTWDVNKNIDV